MKPLNEQWQQRKHAVNPVQSHQSAVTGLAGKDSLKVNHVDPLELKQTNRVNHEDKNGGLSDRKTRYMGRMAVNSRSVHCKDLLLGNEDKKQSSAIQTLGKVDHLATFPSQKTKNGSFGIEFDENVLCVMDQLERDYMSKAEQANPADSCHQNFEYIDEKNINIKCVSKSKKNLRKQLDRPENIKQNSQNLPASDLVTEVVKGHLGVNIELDLSGPWETPLHVSTPANYNGSKGKYRSSGRIACTPKSVSTKSFEKARLFQAILSSDEEVENKAKSMPNAMHAANSNLESECSLEPPTPEGNPSCRPTDDDRLLLSSWGLPEAVLEKYKDAGITRMFQWQAECLCTGNALTQGNLIYAAPTSAGKTMVAELLMLKCILETRKKAIFILPFVSVAREKVSYLQGLYRDAGVRVDGYFGNSNPAGGFASVDIAICTIEKANNLVNRLLEESAIEQLGIIVVDELHMVGDSHRGYLLELLLTKLRFVTSQMKAQKQLKDAGESVSPDFKNPIQVVGMSATLPNLDLLARWLDADLYRTDFRPVPLTEMVKIGLEILDSSLNRLRNMNADQIFKGDEDHIIPLCLETIKDGCSVLIFCPTKNWCEKLADSIAKEFFRIFLQPAKQSGFVKASDLMAGPLNHSLLKDVVDQLKCTPVGCDPMLNKMIPCGVAFHHAGLTFDERDIVEGAFRLGALKVLVATSTLSSGVNLPARRVIVRTPIFHGSLIDAMVYKQMIGRAGRKGVDSQGESILVCKPSERRLIEGLLKSELPPVSSCLFPVSSGGLTSSMKRAILEIIVSKVASTPDQVNLYARCTMLSAELEMRTLDEVPPCREDISKANFIKTCIEYLKDNEFIILSPKVDSDGTSTNIYTPTQLGSAVVASGLSPDEGLTVFVELQKARKCFVLENELHTVYLVTPIYMLDQWATMNWYQYLCIWEHLPQDMKRVGELVGVQERFLERAAGGRISCESAQQSRLVAVHKRFYSALVLHDLINEMPLSTAVRKYGCPRGSLQSLQQSASTFAGMVTVFCNKLGWSNLEMLLSHFQCRLSFGVQHELVDLIRISVLNGQRARVIYNAGFTSVAVLATAESAVIERLLHTASPFLSKKKADDEMDWELAERLKSRCIWATGQKGLTEREAAVLIVDEAKELLQGDLLRMGIEWKPSSAVNVAEDKPGSSSHRIGYKSKCTSKTKKKTNRDATASLDLDNDSPIRSGNISVLTPPVSMQKFVQQNSRDFSKQSSKLFDVANQSREHHSDMKIASDFNTCDYRLNSVKLDSGKPNENLFGLPGTVEARSAGSDISKACSEVTKKNNIASESADAANEKEAASKVESVKDASDTCQKMIVVSDSVKDDRQIGIGNRLADLNRQPSAAEEKIGKQGDEIIEEMELSDGSFLLDTQTIKMMCKTLDTVHFNQKVTFESASKPHLQEKFTGQDEFRPVLQQNYILNSKTGNELSQIHSVQKDIFPENEVDTPLLFSGSEGSLNMCQFGGSFLTREPPGCNNFNYTSEKDENNCIPKVVRERTNSPGKKETNLNGDHLPCKMKDDKEEDYPAQTFTNLVPLSIYERERCSQQNRYSDTLFDEDASKENESVNEGRDKSSPYLDSRNAHQQEEEECAAISNQSLFLSSDISNIVENVSITENINTAGVELENKCLIRCDGAEKVEVSVESLTESMIAKVLADSTIPVSDQNESLFGLNVCPKAILDSNAGVNSRLFENANHSMKTKTTGTKDVELNVKPASTCREKRQLSQKKVQNISPTVEDLMDIFCDDETKMFHKRISKRTKSDAKTVSGMPQDCSFEKEPKRLRKNCSAQTVQGRNADNTKSDSGRRSTDRSRSIGSGSDSSTCIPPTPPSIADELSKTSTPKRLIGGVTGTPKRPDPKPPGLDVDAKEQLLCLQGMGSFSSKITDRVEGDIANVTHRQEINDCLRDDDHSMLIQTQSLTIVDVAASRMLFENFIQEWRQKETFSLSVACERFAAPQPSKTIGSKFATAARTVVPPSERLGLVVEGSEMMIVGLAVSWENCDAYYISLMPADDKCDLDGSLSAPPLDLQLPVQKRLDSIRSVLQDGRHRTIVLYDLKEQYKLMSSVCGIVPQARFLDVKVASWLLDPDAKEKNLHSMVVSYCPIMQQLFDGIGSGAGIESLGLTVSMSVTSGRVRSSVESVAVNYLMNALMKVLANSNMQNCFADMEMPAVEILAKMELNGMGFSEVESEVQKNILLAKLEALEDRAYLEAGHPFSLTSTDDISQVLFVELCLPATGDPSTSNPVKCLGTTRRGKSTKGRAKQSFSTSKDILEKLKAIHPLPGIILEWRRISNALTKVVFPLQKEKSYNAHLDMFRIYGKSDFQTSTGRVTMCEPNLQNIPRDFDIKIPDDCPVDGKVVKLTKSTRRHQTETKTPQSTAHSGSTFSVSMRNSFVPFKGGIMMAADYSQLELRIIAHLSNDRKLIEVLNGGEDVFKAIAAQLKMVRVESVTTEQRQQAKQVCYGMIYGIGAQALGEQLGVSENEASVFIETFKNKYTGMRRFLFETVKMCREEGCVRMITGRVRYLPAIKDANVHARAHAERQAVNSTVQGSAADLVKTAMIRIDRELRERFPETVMSHRHLRAKSDIRTRTRIAQPASKVRGAYFILQLHDELIYEVNESDFTEVARIIKQNMENAMKLSVKLPVKLKAGPSWGSLLDVDT